VGHLFDWVPLEVLTPRVVHTEPPIIQQLNLNYSFIPLDVSDHGVFAHDSLYLPMFFSNLRAAGYPVTSFL
jgi:hypothetical protein